MWWEALISVVDIKQDSSNVKICCPYCGEKKYNLEISKELRIYHCWVCDAKGRAGKLFADLGLELEDDFIPERQEEKEEVKDVEMPKGFKVIDYMNMNIYSAAVVKYLDRRRVSKEQVLRNGIGYVYGEFKVVVPLNDMEGNLAYWVARNIGKVKKYMNPVRAKDTFVAVMPGVKEEFVLCEGVFDALAIQREGWNAVPMLGKLVSERKIEVLVSALRDKKVVILLDSDAQKDAAELRERLMRFRMDVRIAKLKTGDPGDAEAQVLCTAIEARVENNMLQEMLGLQ